MGNSSKNKKKQLNKNNLNAKKKYGQNFLEDDDLALKIIDCAQIDENIDLIEIGPGHGFLTKYLIDKGKSLTAFEIDDDLIPILKKKFSKYNNFELVHIDFMQIELIDYIKDKNNIKVVANIPYYITSPIINKLIKYRNYISEIYLMVQKEVAERITAEKHTKNMSLLTHGVQFFGKADYLFTVGREMFNPIPNVDSAIIKIKLYNDKKYENQIDEEEYFKYLKTSFSNKRKSIANNLSSLGYSKDYIYQILEKCGKNKLARAEEFSIQEFIDFINLLKKDEDKN